MSAWWLLLLPAGAWALGKTTLGNMAQQEAQTRLSRLPCLLLRIAARRLPTELRDDLSGEWEAELGFILTGTDGLPLTRLWRGTRYAGGLLASARRIYPREPRSRAQALAEADTTDEVIALVLWVSFGIICALLAAVMAQADDQAHQGGFDTDLSWMTAGLAVGCLAMAIFRLQRFLRRRGRCAPSADAPPSERP
jgi:hypothetical protein